MLLFELSQGYFDAVMAFVGNAAKLWPADAENATVQPLVNSAAVTSNFIDGVRAVLFIAGVFKTYFKLFTCKDRGDGEKSAGGKLRLGKLGFDYQVAIVSPDAAGLGKQGKDKPAC